MSNRTLVNRVSRVLCRWRNGKKIAFPDFDALSEAEKSAYREQAQAALDTCHADQMRSLLKRLDDCHLGDRTFDEAAVYEVWQEARALLAKVDGQTVEGGV